MGPCFRRDDDGESCVLTIAIGVSASGAAQMKAITLWGAASAAGAALGPLVGGVLVDVTGWQGLFWITPGSPRPAFR